jgi:hypothetical protein
VLTKEQRSALHNAITEYGVSFHNNEAGGPGTARIAIVDLVSTWLDQAVDAERKRCAKAADRQASFYESAADTAAADHSPEAAQALCTLANAFDRLAATLRAGKGGASPESQEPVYVALETGASLPLSSKESSS